MLRLLGEHFLKNCTRFPLVPVAGVASWGSRNNRQRIKDGCFPIFGIRPVNCFHLRLVSQSASSVIGVIPIVVERENRVNVGFFTRRLGSDNCGSSAGVIALFPVGGIRWLPDLVV